MKRISTLILALPCLFAAVNAQPVFTNAQVPTAGSVLTFGSASIPEAFQINPGPNQTWTFNNVNSEGMLTLEFLSPAAVPAAESVEGCNLVMKYTYEGDPEPNYDFNLINPGAWSTLANSATPDFVNEFYDKPDTLFQLPLNSTSDYSSSSYYSSSYYVGAPDFDSVKFISNTITRNHVDAWGTLNLNGIDYSVLKMLVTSTSLDSTFNYSNGTWSFQEANTYEDITHMFISPEAGGIVMSISAFENELGQTDWFVFYMLSKSITSVNKIGKVEDFKLYPNPANSFVNVAFSATDSKNQQVVITDVSGKIVKTQHLKGNSNSQIELSGLNKGVYFVSLSGNSATPQKLIIQ